ncbi:MAG: hypothetical protein LBD20_08405, partial [Spirochaetaceae bacterium]|nr:hypothetical protein [Spirochaetaceae bacterium]
MRILYVLIIFSAVNNYIFAQTNTSVPLSDAVYQIIDHAELRGLCGPLPKVKPYSRTTVLRILGQIESADSGRYLLSGAERETIRLAKARLQKEETGLHLAKGFYRLQTETGNGTRISAEAGFGLETRLSGGIYLQDSEHGAGFVPGLDFWPLFRIAGDIGENFSYGFAIHGGAMYANRAYMGENYLYYDGYEPEGYTSGDTLPQEKMEVLTHPRAFIPYSYHGKWDGIVWEVPHINNSDFLVWPKNLSIGYGTYSEFAGNFFSGIVTYRIGRMEREYGGMVSGYSMTLNAAAQPFLGFDVIVSPFSWLTISSVTGILEFYSLHGEKISPQTFQNAYSLSQIELNYKNYIHLSFGSTVVWPKRFELAYMIPLIDKHLYQMNIGDFDNTAEFANLKLQLPGIGSLWGALFLDEINPEPNIFELDRALYAFQAGVAINIPPLPFGSIVLSYTKIEPYTYSHPKTEVPWYGTPMEEAFVNHGDPLGYYLKPNSDEIKAAFRFMPHPRVQFHAQYQLIRHGAEIGGSQVDGSSYYSELGKDRSVDPHYRKYFLHDGAYEWNHIIRAGAGWDVPRTLMHLFAEAGFALSSYTDITEGSPNDG